MDEDAVKYIEKNYPQTARCFKAIQNDQYILFCKKQKDYGPANISKFGIFGVIVRVSDKIERLINLHQKATQPDTYPISVQNEPIEDSWTDLSVYGAIARVVNNDEWSKEP